MTTPMLVHTFFLLHLFILLDGFAHSAFNHLQG